MAVDVWMALRAMVARRDGIGCCYCKVPTAATLEHVTARSRNGGHRAENLRLACPSCNSRKRDEPLDSWMSRKGWLMDKPSELPPTVSQMIRSHFDPQFSGQGYFSSGSTNSRLLMQEGRCILEVRPGRNYPWVKLLLGPEDHPRAVLGAYDFLRRHNTKTVRQKGPARA